MLLVRREQFLFSSDAAEELKEDIAKGNHELVFLSSFNLVDEIWKESRPQPPNKPIRVHDLKYAGADVSSKLFSLRTDLINAGSSAIVISMLDEIAWLLNLVSSLNLTQASFDYIVVPFFFPTFLIEVGEIVHLHGVLVCPFFIELLFENERKVKLISRLK